MSPHARLRRRGRPCRPQCTGNDMLGSGLSAAYTSRLCLISIANGRTLRLWYGAEDDRGYAPVQVQVHAGGWRSAS